MTLPPVIRIFFAIDLPTSAKQHLGNFISGLKKKSKSSGIRWTKPENLHITLQFLAEVKVEHLPKLMSHVREHLEEKTVNSTITVGQLHLFPNPYRPRVIVLDVVPQDHLAMLSGMIGQGIKAADYEIEERPFRAHLTLGRIKQPHEANLNFLSSFSTPDVGLIDVDEVILFRSESHEDGSHYMALDKIALSKKAKVS